MVVQGCTLLYKVIQKKFKVVQFFIRLYNSEEGCTMMINICTLLYNVAHSCHCTWFYKLGEGGRGWVFWSTLTRQLARDWVVEHSLWRSLVYKNVYSICTMLYIAYGWIFVHGCKKVYSVHLFTAMYKYTKVYTVHLSLI